MISLDVAPGIHRIEDAYTNWYLVEGDDGMTVVDSGFPSSWRSLQEALERAGRSPDDIRALVLTHGHFDHVGFAQRAAAELGIPVWAHRDEAWLAGHPYRYETESSRLPYLVRPPFLKTLGAMALAGALGIEGVREVEPYEDGQELPVPGRPRVIATPGHTFGHCSLLLEDRGALIAGDAIVTLDPYTGLTGPRLVARAATAQSARALASLDRIAATGDVLVLPGHGEPVRGAEDAAAQARAAGAA